LNFEYIVVWADGEIVAGKREGHIWKFVALVAIDSVLTVESLFGANLFVPIARQACPY